MKKITFAVLLFFTPIVQAQESSISIHSMNTLKEVRKQIETLETKIETLETYVNNVITCGNATPPKHYNGTTCITITERDANIKNHGKATLSSSSCTSTDEAQQFSGSSWQCKTFN